MSKSVKFTVSMPAADFKKLEAGRGKTGRTRSQYIRDAVRISDVAGDRPPGPGIEEEAGSYKTEASMDLTGLEERRRRALSAAGRFRSGHSDLSSAHDRYLEDDYATVAPAEDAAPAGKPR